MLAPALGKHRQLGQSAEQPFVVGALDERPRHVDDRDAVVLETLRALAPVRAVRGNNDKGPWAAGLPCSDVVEAGGQMLYVLHDVADLDLEPAAAGFAAVLSGHSHRPSVERSRGVLYLNPGSAGPRRFTLPIAVAKLTVSPRRCDARIVELPA